MHCQVINVGVTFLHLLVATMSTGSAMSGPRWLVAIGTVALSLAGSLGLAAGAIQRNGATATVLNDIQV